MTLIHQHWHVLYWLTTLLERVNLFFFHIGNFKIFLFYFLVVSCAYLCVARGWHKCCVISILLVDVDQTELLYRSTSTRLSFSTGRRRPLSYLRRRPMSTVDAVDIHLDWCFHHALIIFIPTRLTLCYLRTIKLVKQKISQSANKIWFSSCWTLAQRQLSALKCFVAQDWLKAGAGIFDSWNALTEICLAKIFKGCCHWHRACINVGLNLMNPHSVWLI